MTKDKADPPVRLDLNNPIFQDGLFSLERPERLAALETVAPDHDSTYGKK